MNLYEDGNAFYREGGWKRVPVPMMRDAEGRIEATMEDAIRYELVLGTKGRSGEQFDVWQAVYGPAGPDGYPAPPFDPRTGAIDQKVAEYWREHYDLVGFMQRNWNTLGPKVVGKLHFTSGTADAFYLERPVKLAQQFLEKTNPYYGGTIEFSGLGHGGGPPEGPPQMNFHELVIREFAERLRKDGREIR